MDNSPTLYEALKASYGDKQAIQNIQSQGYNLDNFLSNNDVKVFHNPNKNKLLIAGAGTHKMSDIATDVNLAIGNLKNTDRYKEARDILNKAKTKYQPKDTTIVGHSLFGTIAGYIANKNDRVITLDKGATIGQKTRKNEIGYRTSGDVVSLLNANSKRVRTLPNPNIATSNLIRDTLKAHDLKNIKNYSNIRI